MKKVTLITRELIEDCQNGKPQAQHAVYNALAGKMFAVCLRYSRNSTEAEDCLQDGFVKVFTKINDFRHDGVFEGWVRLIMVNTALEQFRKKNPLSCFEVLENQFFEPLTSDFDTANLNVEFLMKLIQEMPPQYQVVFSLYGIDGYSHEEIAQQLGISVGTSKSNLSRGRKWLQNKIAVFEESENKSLSRYASY